MRPRDKKENAIVKNYKDALKALKEEMLEEIINSDVMTKVEKLECISHNNLLPYCGYIQHPFYKYVDEFKQIIWSNPKFDEKYGAYMRNGRKYEPIIDDYFCCGDRWDRHQNVDMSQVCGDIEDDDWYGDHEEGITVLTNRSTDDVFKISKNQFIDDIYDWCIDNKKIGFNMDW
jgi:hypothetical protein